MAVLDDLADRWTRARRAALRAVVVEPARDAGAELPPASDDALLRSALASDAAAELYKRVFDNSLKLGTGFAQFYGAEVPLEDLPHVLGELDAPCLAGDWTRIEGEPALRLERAGCPARAMGSGACDFWREAVDGLVLGLTGGIRHARHACAARGGGVCVDVVYVRPESPQRFGPIPEPMREPLEHVKKLARTFDDRVRIDFLGLSEGVLFYRETRSGPADGVSVGTLVERSVRRRFPNLDVKETSPRPVLEGDGG